MKVEQSSVIAQLTFACGPRNSCHASPENGAAPEEQTMNRIFKEGRWRSNGNL
jgi:hypothetical protein